MLALKPPHSHGPCCALAIGFPDQAGHGDSIPGVFTPLVLQASEPILATPLLLSGVPQPCQTQAAVSITAAPADHHWAFLYQGPALAGLLCAMAALFTACFSLNHFLSHISRTCPTCSEISAWLCRVLLNRFTPAQDTGRRNRCIIPPLSAPETRQ